jgi:type IV pilus assembly protein PilM
VRRVWKKSGTRAKHVALGMPPAAVITKKIILPAGLSEDQLEVQVESEASQYIPFALDEVSLDFDVIGPAANSPKTWKSCWPRRAAKRSRTAWRSPKRPA